ncbi:MAG: leucine-rich repeat domain-containing protein [Limisphaerales bacterium]
MLFDQSQATLIRCPGGLGGSYTIPASVTSIAQDAFEHCGGLTSVTIPASVTNIGDWAFFICGSLTSVTIPASVTSIGDWAFYNCGSLTSVTILYGVTSIGAGAFDLCTSLYSVAIPESVTNIGSSVFKDCWSLYSVAIPESVTSIGFDAFANCFNLNSVYFEGNGPPVDSSVFWDDPVTLCLYHLSGANDGYYYSINPDNTNTATIVFYSGPGGDLSIPTNINGLTVTDIGDGTNFAFAYTRVTNVVIPGGVTTIGTNAFNDCTSLTSVTISDGVTSIGENAFYGCTSLANVAIPAGVTSIGYQAFGDCTNLTSVYFNGNAPAVGSNAFSQDAAAVYYLPCTTGWSSTFAGLWTMPWWQKTLSYTTNAGAITITGYSGLCGDVVTILTIPAAINNLPVTGIGTNAFYYCTNLATVTIPASVTNIGVDAFCRCTNLTIVYFNGNAPAVGSNAFALDPATVYYLPGTSGWGDFATNTGFTPVLESEVTNSSFETGNFNGWILSGDTLYDFVAEGSVYGILPHSGIYLAALGSFGSLSYLSQTLTTMERTPYLLSLWLDSPDGETPNEFLVSWNGNTLFDDTNIPAVGWTNLQFLVSATRTSTVLEFGFRDDPSYLWLDDISILPVQPGFASFGVQSNQFGFSFTGPANLAIVVEACTNLASPVWVPLQTNTLSNGSFSFSEPLQTNNSGRYYRITSP